MGPVACLLLASLSPVGIPGGNQAENGMFHGAHDRLVELMTPQELAANIAAARIARTKDFRTARRPRRAYPAQDGRHVTSGPTPEVGIMEPGAADPRALPLLDEANRLERVSAWLRQRRLDLALREERLRALTLALEAKLRAGMGSPS